MKKEEIYEVINGAPVIFLATLDGDEPRVRGMMLYRADDDGIVFHTGPVKDVYHQIMKNPKVQMCFYDAEKGVQVRVRGALEKIDDKELKDEISNHPSRIFMQSWKADCATEQEFYDMFSVFRLKNGKANVWSFETNFAPKEDVLL